MEDTKKTREQLIRELIELRASDEKFKTLCVSVQDAVIMIDNKGNVVFWNKAAEVIFGYTEKEIIGKKMHTLLVPQRHHDTFKNGFIKFKKTGTGSLVGKTIELTGLRKDKTEFPIELFLSAVKIKGLWHAIGISRDITKRKKTEETIKRKLEFEKMISEISSRFIGIYDIDKAINSSLADIGNLSAASRAYLFLFREDGAIMDNTHEWCAKGVQAEIDNLQNLPTDMFPWWMKKLSNKEVIHIKDVSRMPIEAKMEKEILESQGIKSLLVLPLYVKGKSAGFIGFDNVSETEEWRNEDLSILRMSSEIIGNGIVRERAEKALLESEEKYRTVVEKTGDIPYVMDDKAVVSYIGPQVEKYGFRVEDIVDRNFIEIIYTEDKEKTIKDFQKTMQNGIEAITTFRVETPKMGIRYFEENGRILRDDEGQIIGLAGIIRDITERKRAEETLKQKVKEARFLSLIDDLTGLYNRRGFFTLAEQHLKLSRRKKRELLVVYVDVDQLKGINDTLGHRVGSLALIETGNILKETFRESDIIARIGGDEFVVLAIETSGTNPKSIAARFQKNLEEHNSRRNRPYKYNLSISLGISRYDPKNPCSIDELVDRADKLMYKEKRRKKTEVRALQ
ncbi:MAG: sensor domain-containing diguanylate cyclase [Candidatus Cloacimonadota bacterium]|nr:MAG: sensor domain-containing diguanylate cyclase [Candidatus Cloacimonadota bacterium]